MLRIDFFFNEIDQKTEKLVILFCTRKDFSWYNRVISLFCIRGWILLPKTRDDENC